MKISKIIPGESVLVKIDYDLFGVNIKNKCGIFVSQCSNNSLLVFFPEEKEWAELKEENLERISPGKITSSNKKFMKLVKKMP